MRVQVAFAAVLCHLCLAATVTAAPVGSLPQAVTVAETKVNTEHEGAHAEGFFRLPSRSTAKKVAIPALLGFAIFVFLVAPLVLRVLEKQEKEPEKQDQEEQRTQEGPVKDGDPSGTTDEGKKDGS